MTTDDLQVQQKSNAVPYGLIGAGAGAGVGALAAKYANVGYKPAPNLDKVFAQEPDEFKSQMERRGANKGAWETAQNWAQKIKESDKKFEEIEAEVKSSAKAVETQISDDVKEKKEFKAARENYDNKLQELMKETKAEGDGLVKEHKWASVLNPNDYADDDALKDALKKKGVKGKNGKTSLVDQYKEDYQKLMDARTDVENKLTGIKNNRMTKIKVYDTELAKLVRTGAADVMLEDLNDTELKNLSSELKKKVSLTDRRTKENKISIDIAKSELPEINVADDLTNKETALKELGFTEGKVPAKGSYKTFTVERTASNGLKYDVTYYMEAGKFDGAVKKYNKNLEGKNGIIERRAAQIRTGIRARINAAIQNKSLDKNVISSIPNGTGKNKIDKDALKVLDSEGAITTVKDATTGNITKVTGLNKATIESWSAETFNTERKAQEQIIKNNKDILKDPSRTADHAAAQTAIDDANKEISKINAKHKLLRIYNHENSANIERLANAYRGVPGFEGFDKEVSNAYQDKELAKMNKLFEEKYKGVIEGGTMKEVVSEAKGMTEEEAKKFIEEKTDLSRKLKEKEEALEKYAKDHKIEPKELTGDELAKALKEKCGASSKAEYSKTIREQATKECQSILKDLKMAHVGWTAAGAAVVLGAAGLIAGLAGKKNDDIA